MYEKLLSVIILRPDILSCLNLSGTINLHSDFLKSIAVPPLGRPQRTLELESVPDVPVYMY